jgi:hypothetical protein
MLRSITPQVTKNITWENTPLFSAYIADGALVGVMFPLVGAAYLVLVWRSSWSRGHACKVSERAIHQGEVDR